MAGLNGHNHTFEYSRSVEDWNGSYYRRLAPFLGISILVHAAIFAIAFGLAYLAGTGRGLDVQLFEPGDQTASWGNQPLLAGFDAPDRMKIFRVDFFREIILWHPPEPEAIEVEPVPVEELIAVTEPEVVPEEPEEEPEEEIIEEEPVEEEEVILSQTSAGETEPAVEAESPLIASAQDLFGTPENENPENPEMAVPAPILAQPDLSRIASEGEFTDESAFPDAIGVFLDQGTPENVNPDEVPANVFPLPEWVLTDKDNVEWSAPYFLGNYTIYLIGDISSRHGLDDLLAWNYVLRKLITNPQAAYPPNVVTVASTIENPYAYDEESLKSLLTEEHETEHTFGVQIADPEGRFAASLGYTSLPQPIVMFVDDFGYIRMIMIGRIRDISGPNIQQAMSVIAEMWQWTEQERQVLPTAVQLIINLLRDESLDVTKREAPPLDIEYRIAPTWGYPVLQDLPSDRLIDEIPDIPGNTAL